MVSTGGFVSAGGVSCEAMPKKPLTSSAARRLSAVNKRIPQLCAFSGPHSFARPFFLHLNPRIVIRG